MAHVGEKFGLRQVRVFRLVARVLEIVGQTLQVGGAFLDPSFQSRARVLDRLQGTREVLHHAVERTGQMAELVLAGDVDPVGERPAAEDAARYHPRVYGDRVYWGQGFIGDGFIWDSI